MVIPTWRDISTGYIQNVEQNIILSDGTRLPASIFYPDSSIARDTQILYCIKSTSSGDEYLIDTYPWPDANCSQYGQSGSLLVTERIQSAGYLWNFSRPWILTISSLFFPWGIVVCGI